MFLEGSWIEITEEPVKKDESMVIKNNVDVQKVKQ